MSNIQAVIRKTVTVAATYTGIPSAEERKALKAAGAEYKNGQWIRSVSESGIVTEQEATKLFQA